MLAQSSSTSLPNSLFPQNLPTTNSMCSDHEQFVLELFDNLWFMNGVLLSKGSWSSPVVVAAKDDEEDEPAAGDVPRLYRAPSMIGRSISDQALSSKDNQSDSDSSTPKSVLAMRPALQTILSGKEVGEFEQVMTDCTEGCAENRVIEKMNSRSRGGGGGGRRRRRNNGSSRSLSELEYEELKGFMDLGFVFSDEDKDSSLVSIIPGLQRLGTKKDNESSSSGTGDNNKGFYHYQSSSSSVPRPYLSEAWDFQEMENTLKPLANWRIPAFGNEMELKDHLKFWAHTVASTVR